MAGLKARGEMGARDHARWMVRLAAAFLDGGVWMTALQLLGLIPPSYLRLLPDDCADDPELAEKAYQVGTWLSRHLELRDGSEEIPQVHLHLGKA